MSSALFKLLAQGFIILSGLVVVPTMIVVVALVVCGAGTSGYLGRLGPQVVEPDKVPTTPDWYTRGRCEGARSMMNNGDRQQHVQGLETWTTLHCDEFMVNTPEPVQPQINLGPTPIRSFSSN
jgi:hypothetical protein